MLRSPLTAATDLNRDALPSTTRKAMLYAFLLSLVHSVKPTHYHFQWIIVDSRVYDVSKFANLHPGGAAVLLVDSIGNSLSLPWL
jgi:Cytochrome b5-like Heme/Steroid binding domain